MRTESRIERELKGLRSQKISHIELEQGYTRRDSTGKVEYTAEPKAPQKFNYRVKNSQVLLLWEDQKNLTAPHYFEIQRASDGSNFEAIGNTKNDSFLDIPDLNKDARGSNIPTTYWYRVRIRKTKDDLAGQWSYVHKVTISGISATDISTEIADMLQAGQNASSIAQILYDYAAGYGVDITEAFGHLNGESFDSATVKVEGTDPSTGETTTKYKDFSYIFRNFIIGDVILGNLIKGEHIEANTITANNIAAGTITANELSADAITGESLDINTILSSDSTLIDGGNAESSYIETYDGGTAGVESNRNYNDDRGIYTGIPRNYITIKSPIFFKGGLTGEIKSDNYKVGSSGYKISPEGDVEFNNGTFRGRLIATDGTFTGNIITPIFRLIQAEPEPQTIFSEGGYYLCGEYKHANGYTADEIIEKIEYLGFTSPATPDTGSLYDNSISITKVEYDIYQYTDGSIDYTVYFIVLYDDDNNIIDEHTKDGYNMTLYVEWPSAIPRSLCWGPNFSDYQKDVELIFSINVNEISFPGDLPSSSAGLDSNWLFAVDNGDGTATLKIKL